MFDALFTAGCPPHLPSSQIWFTAQIRATGAASVYVVHIKSAFQCYLMDTVFLDLLTFSCVLFWHPLFKDEIHDLRHTVWIRAQNGHEIEAEPESVIINLSLTVSDLQLLQDRMIAGEKKS